MLHLFRNTTRIAKTFMRHSYLLYFFVAIMLSSCSKTTEPVETSFKRYPFKNVYIKYAITGDGSGTEELYIYNYGERELVKSNYISTVGGQFRQNNQSVITRVGDLYIYVPGAPVGQHVHVRSLDSLYNLKENFPSYTEIIDSLLEQGKFQLEGSEIIAGVPTQRWKQVMGNVTLFYYKGLVLKRVVDGEDGTSLVQSAISVDTVWNADTALFTLPAGMTFQNGPLMIASIEPIK